MKKIHFNDNFGLIQAVLDRQKSIKRIIISQKEIEKVNQFQVDYYNATFEKLEGKELLEHYFFVEKIEKLPYKVGEVVAIAQCYKDIWEADHDRVILYDCSHAGYKNKLFVKADEMPHHIRIVNVRVEKLQDISDEDCLKEGIYKGQCGSADTHFMDAYYYKGDIQPYCTSCEAFASLIDKLSGRRTWEKNPWVFVYEFELVD